MLPVPKIVPTSVVEAEQSAAAISRANSFERLIDLLERVVDLVERKIEEQEARKK